MEFEIGGQAFDLQAYDAGDELFLVFGDLTTGRETYPAGRFLYAKKPDGHGVMELDFNRAHSRDEIAIDGQHLHLDIAGYELAKLFSYARFSWDVYCIVEY